jgi:3-oxoacyl-(acyl-carrier-protein) synthase
MREVYLTAGEILTCAGDIEGTWSALLSRKTALAPKKLAGFDQAWPLGVIPDLPDEGQGTNVRLDALFDRLFRALPPLEKETPLILATTKGAADEFLDQQAPYQGQPWQIGEQLCKRLSLTGGHTTVSAACASSTIAIIQAALRIAGGECEQALVVGVDLVSRFVLGGFASLKGLSPGGCRPFDSKRDGLSLGEGGGWLLLSNHRTSFNSTGCVLFPSGWGITCDAVHITAPCRRGSGLIAAISQATSNMNGAVGGINAHGTGTIYNDAMELTAFNAIWGLSGKSGTKSKKCQEPPPVCSVKGGIGHCLGAAGIIEAVLSLKSLETGVLPPTVGFMESAANTPQISGQEAIPLHSPSILSCNSGFGGINAAVVFSRLV